MEPPILKKKLIKDGTSDRHKEILGWVLDGIAQTIELPKSQCDKILHKLQTVWCTDNGIKLKTLQNYKVSPLRPSKSPLPNHF